MPELAEVFYYSKQWDAGKGKPVRRVELNGKDRVFRGCDVEALADGLTGSKLVRSHTHGKQMMFEFSGGHWLGVHLGMTGKIVVNPEPFEPEKHDHLVLHLATMALVFSDYRKFGRIRYEESKGLPTFWAELPPQPVDETFTPKRVTEFLKRHPKTPLKALLLDQEGFPGIGNWMADEILWQEKIAPRTLAGVLDEKKAKSLWKTVKKICDVSMKTIGVDWSDPPQTWLFKHRWSKGHHCPRCNEQLVREDVRGRTACWCTKCQIELK